MRALRSLLGSRAHAATMAVVALALQASSSGYVPACPMKMPIAASHACCQMRAQAAMPGCHAMGKMASSSVPARRACCFLGVISPCADGVVSEARLTAPTSIAAVVAATPATTADWAALAVPASTASPPIPEALPHRSSVLLI